jgi:polyisoprenoid-binding protein YceI
MILKSIVVVLFLTAGMGAPAQSSTRLSLITIHVEKTGFFSGFAHNHTVIAPVEQVRIDTKNLSAEITVLAKRMKVTDAEASESDRSEIQSTMLGPKVLDVEKYPEVRFQSARIERVGESYRVTGTLNLHGVAKEISFEVWGTADHCHGKTTLNQTDFGIKPVSIAGGAVKVKDQVKVEFDIYPGEFASLSR